MRCDQEKLAALRVRIEIMRKRKQNYQKESQIAVDKKSQQIKAKESNNKITVTDTEVDDDGSTTSTEDYPDKKRNREQEVSVISSDEIDEKRTDESNEDDRQSEEADVTRLPKVFDTSVSAEDYPDKKRNREQEESVISSDEIDEKRTDESNEDDRQSEEADMTRLPKVFDTSVSAEDYSDKKRNREQEESVISSDEIDEKRTDESNEDDRQSEEADVKRLPKVFDISVSAEEFEEMLPANQISKQKKLQFVKGWTHIVADKFSKVNPACILKFKYHKVQEKKENSFRNRCFFFTKAECKHANCGVWTMKIDKKPKRESQVVITVTQTQPVIKHKKAGKRQLSNTQRKKAQERMKKESVESIFWQQYEDMPEAELRAENYTKCQSGTILRKAKSETKTGDILHPEPFTELVILKEVYDEENGYIQKFICPIHGLSFTLKVL
ncbi:stage VI sporulation protein D-like [Ruditapes philippinarum]|uniref:stage VI sporulation protein D-like n=1 Tax=Ruditapes philippinarum TaxID=129788 RepID=UPI00295B9190|nr:stage VI sporulation protein D-like [Ruditapes philippinarum]